MRIILEMFIAFIFIYIFIEFVIPIENSFIFLLLFFLYMPFVSLIIAPLLRIKFLYKYYSKAIVVQFPNKKIYDLHLSSHLDLILLVKNKSNKKKIVFYEIADGLLNICKEIEDEILPQTLKIKATTFFLNQNSLKKFGFMFKTNSPLFAPMFLFDYIMILITNYIITGNFRFVNIFKIKTASITGGELLKNKSTLEKLSARLKIKA